MTTTTPYRETQAIPPEELARLAERYSPRDLARILGVTAGSVRRRLNRLGLRRDERGTLNVRQLRDCMCCARPFAPEHRHNRLCRTCAEDTPDYEVKL